MNIHYRTIIALFILVISAVFSDAQDAGKPHGIVDENGTSLSGPNYQISKESGIIKQNNLFHRFQTFNLHKDETATFTSFPECQNIINYITGNGIPAEQAYSWINGRILSSSQANFFFINPSGIFFGPNASIDIQGAFYASTADYLSMNDGSTFGNQVMLDDDLSVAPPEAFGFIDTNKSVISFERTSLQHKTSNDIIIAANMITLDNASIQSPEGLVRLSNMNESGKILCNDTINNENRFDGTISLTNQSALDVSGAGSGDIQIRAGEFTIDNSQLMAITFGNENGGCTHI
ncbi:Large exoprotein containing hemagglutination activity domain protein, partial [Candidatus Magnetomorum sp. HK-1]